MNTDIEKLMRYVPFLLLWIVILLLCVYSIGHFQESVYTNGVMIALWCALIVSGVYVLLRNHRRRILLLIFHFSFVVILLGGLLTHLFSDHGTIHLREGYVVEAFYGEDSGEMLRLPSPIELKCFDMEYYKGTSTVSDYKSTLQVADREVVVSMNNIYEERGFRIYQSSYDSDMRGTVLLVTYDPWGVPITYIGYLILTISMGAMIVDKRGKFRALIESPILKMFVVMGMVALPLLFLCPQCSSNASVDTLEIPVQVERNEQKEMCQETLDLKRTDIAQVIAQVLGGGMRYASILTLTVGLGLLVLCCINIARGRQSRGIKWVKKLMSCFSIVMGVYMFYMVLRTPAVDVYATLVMIAFLSMVLNVFSNVFNRWGVLSIPTLFVGGITMLIASFGGVDGQTRLLSPVLNSPLLSVHVALMMFSYTMAGVMTLISLASVVLQFTSVRKERRELIQEKFMVVNKVILYPMVMCMTVGIFVGAIWANLSWGSYWTWDPKETWALISLLTYGFAFHSESIVFLRRPLMFQTYLLVAFFCLLFTYVGVNLFMGGMHSYG